jgi:hypothetical protein
VFVGRGLSGRDDEILRTSINGDRYIFIMIYLIYTIYMVGIIQKMWGRGYGSKNSCSCESKRWSR